MPDKCCMYSIYISCCKFLSLASQVHNVASSAVVKNIIKTLAPTNCLLLYGIGCVYNQQLQEKALDFIIEHAVDILHPDFPHLSHIGALRDGDIRRLLTSQHLKVRNEGAVYNFIKAWNTYRDHQIASDETVQALFRSCVRWSCMTITKIQSIAHEGLVGCDWLLPYLLRPQTQPPRIDHGFWMSLKDQSMCHQKYHIKIPVTRLSAEGCVFFNQFCINFHHAIVDGNLRFYASWINESSSMADGGRRADTLTYVVTEVCMLTTEAQVSMRTAVRVNSVLPETPEVPEVHELVIHPPIEFLVTDRTFVHGGNLDYLICQFVFVAVPSCVSLPNPDLEHISKVFIGDLEMPAHFLSAGYTYVFNALSREWRIHYTPSSAVLSVLLRSGQARSDDEQYTYRLRIVCIKGISTIATGVDGFQTIRDADGFIPALYLRDLSTGASIQNYFLMTPPIVCGTSVEYFIDRPYWGVTLRLTITRC